MQPQVEILDVIVRADGLVHTHFHFVDRLGEYSLERLVPDPTAMSEEILPERTISEDRSSLWPLIAFLCLWIGPMLLLLLLFLLRRALI
jgi:hypothetical protein